MEEQKDYTLVIFSEDNMGILARIVGAITRRHININSITSSKSSIPGIHKITIVIHVEFEVVRKLIAQIDKQVDVLKAYFYADEDIVYQEIALYKIPSKVFYESESSESLLRKHHARVLFVDQDYVVIEKTGFQTETEELLKELQNIGIYEFVRSGRVAIVKPMEQLNKHLASIHEQKKLIK